MKKPTQSGIDSGAALVAIGLPPLSPAGRLQVVTELLGGPDEVCVCDRCGDEHVIVHPPLISKEEAIELMKEPTPSLEGER